jgi:hypothetical protein
MIRSSNAAANPKTTLSPFHWVFPKETFPKLKRASDLQKKIQAAFSLSSNCIGDYRKK